MLGTTSFAGRTAVVTGGAHGIGAAIARRLVALGAETLLLDVEKAESCAPTHLVDLGDPAAVIAAACHAVDRLGRVDVLVNCAGISYVAPITALDSSRYHHLLAVNLHAPVALMRELGRGMATRGYGRIVNVTSVHARLGEPGCLAYDVSKAGLEAATRAAAIDLADAGVLVNAVAPGFVSTRLAVVDGIDEMENDWFRTVYVKHAQLPLRRAAGPDEIAGPVAFLASEDNTYTTGQTLLVDGGLTARL